MKTTYLVSHCTPNHIQDLKIAALYFDEIKVIENIINTGPEVRRNPQDMRGAIAFSGDKIDLVHPDYRRSAQIFEQTNIVKYASPKNLVHPLLWNNFVRNGSGLLKSYNELIFCESDQSNNPDFLPYANFYFAREAIETYQYFVTSDLSNLPSIMAFNFNYFADFLCILLSSLATGQNTLTTSSILNNYLRIYNQSFGSDVHRHFFKSENVRFPTIGFEAIKVNIPNLSFLSFEEILELRVALHDELQAFKNELKGIEFNLLEHHDPIELQISAAKLVEQRVTPKIKVSPR